jgi:hypothetical protein
VTVPLFRRRRDGAEDPEVEPQAPGESSADAPEAGFGDAPTEGVDDPPYSRADGPWDASEAPPESEVQRLDLGGLQIPGHPGLELRIEVDQESGNVVSAAAVIGDSVVQMQAFAAPKSRGVWREVRIELAEGIVSAGGTAEEVDGIFGRELRAKIPVESPQGVALQDARFVGVDGPRWFLRGVFSGKAVASGAVPQLEAVLRECIVVRGDVPMAPKDPLPLHLPEEAVGSAGPDERPPLEPFRRGPEITEVH